MKLLGFTFLFFFLISSCTKDEFTQTKAGSSETIDPVKSNSQELCTNFSPPPVDILLVVDNSGSTTFLQTSLKEAITKIVLSAEKFFDYRIYLVPLIPETNELRIDRQSYQLLSNNFSLVPTSTQNVTVHTYEPPNLQQIETQTELGFSRVLSIIEDNSHAIDECHQYGKNLDAIGSYNNKKLCLDTKCRISGDCNSSNTDTISFGGRSYRYESFGQHYRVWIDNEDNALRANKYVFRNNSYLISILLSNGDDTDKRFDSQGNTIGDNFNQRKIDLINLKNQIGAIQYRFLSVVNFSKCGSTVREPGLRYRDMSLQILNTQGVSSTNESFDLCKDNLVSIFKKVTEEINRFKTGHVYNYWPVGDSRNFDPAKLVVKRRNSGTIIQNSASDGYTYDNTFKTDFNIRETPPVGLVPGEYYNGYFIKLNGSAKVSYPECLVIQSTEFTKYYGYVHLGTTKPNVDSIKLKIRGEVVPKNSTNGWEYIGFKESFNIQITSPNDFAPKFPGEIRSGYFLKLNGQAIYNNNDIGTVAPEFLPAGF
jgi:hypothetical protein